MAIPLSYNLRNLTARRTTTIMTALGIALTVAVLLSVSALAEGLRTSLEASGHPLNLLIMRTGSTAELNSVVNNEIHQTIRVKPGVAAASLELVTVIVLEQAGSQAGFNLTVRGLSPDGLRLRDGARVVQGRMFEPGRREVVVGKGIAAKYANTGLGAKLPFGRGEWTVVGVLDAGRGVANSEIFCDLGQLSADQNRQDALSTVLVRANDESALQALVNDLKDDRRLKVTAMREKDYHAQQTQSAAPIRAVGVFVSIIMAVGSCFAAMNTMYAAVARRSAEIGTLRVLGFSRRGILASFLVESLLLSLVGGVLGCLLVLPLNNVSTGIGSFITFSEITFDFRVTPSVMALGIGFALLLGAIGGLFPAFSAARKQILTALREI
jgi:putative ABC transport system permease protein